MVQASDIGAASESSGKSRPNLVVRGMGWAALTCAASLALSLFAWQSARSSLDTETRLRFEFAAREYADIIRDRLISYEQTLWGGVGLVAAAPNVSRSQWQAYVERLDLSRRLPGTQGIGFAQYIRPANRQAHIAAVRAEGFPDYSIRPADERDEYSAIVFLEPFDWRNQRAFGYDMLTEPTRRAAMHRARDSGQAALSTKVTLVQETETEVQAGFLIYVPVYRTGAPPNTVEARRVALAGFVYSPFRANDLLGSLPAPQDAVVEVYDGTALRPEALLYRSPVPAGAAPSSLATDVPLRFAGHLWTLRFTALPRFAAGIERSQPPLILATGLAVSLLATALVAALAYNRARIAAEHGRLQADATERERIEEQLRQSEAKFRLLFEHNPQPMWLLDRETLRFVQVNDTAIATYGYSRDEFARMTLPDIRLPDDPPIVVGAARPPGFRFVMQRRHRLKDGRVIDVEIAAHELQLDGRPLRLVAVRDVTERVQAQAAAEESERLARGIVATALDAFVQIDESGQIVDWNAGAEKMFGWSGAEAIGQPLVTLIVPPAARERHLEGLARFLRTGASNILGRRIEVSALRRGGEEFPCELSVTALQRRSGYVFNAFIHDVSERLAAETQLRRAQKMEAIGHLTGGMAHDFNNLLAVVIGNLDMLADTIGDNARQGELIDRAVGGALRGADLTRRLLAFARRQPLEPQVVALNERLPNLVRLLQGTLGETIHVAAHLGEALWPTRADPSQIEDALINLAINARDAMPNGGNLTIETMNVTLDEHYAAQNPDAAAGDYVALSVTDSGTGMPKEVIERAIEPFFTTKPPGAGSGLGLSMVYGFVRQSGGHLKIYSEPGFGTTVKLYLPRVRDEVPPEALAAPAAAVPRGSERVLLVEDNAAVREVATAQMTELGYRVAAAESAPEALRLLADGERYDLLFTDVVMPGGMTGLELAQQVRQRYPTIKVLFSTGYARIEPRNGEEPMVPGPVLRKPYRKQELAEKLRAVLDA